MFYVVRMGWSAPVIVVKMDKTSSAAIEALFEGAMYSSGWDGSDYLIPRERNDVLVEVLADEIVMQRLAAGEVYTAKKAEEKAAAEIVAAAEAKLAELDNVEAE